MYQVWTKEGYEEAWRLVECPDIADVEAIIRANFGKEVAVKISMPVEYDAKIAVKIHAPKEEHISDYKAPKNLEEIVQEVTGEAAEGEAKPDKVAGAKGHRAVRRGDAPDTP